MADPSASLGVISIGQYSVRWGETAFGAEFNHYCLISGGAEPDWSERWNGYVITWSQATRTITFDAPSGISIGDDSNGLWYYYIDDVAWAGDPPYVTLPSAGLPVWAWADSGFLISNPAYPDIVNDPDSTGNPGALRASQYKQLDTDSRYVIPLTEPLEVGGLYNGVISRNDPAGVAAPYAWGVDYENASQTSLISWVGNSDGSVSVSHDSVPVQLINSAGDWTYPEVYFDPIAYFGITENFFYKDLSGDPWTDTRILDFIVVNVPRLYNRLLVIEQKLHDAGITGF
jgi:hypothetical protein